jgi:hypothetical protein
MKYYCPACGGNPLRPFYRVENIPVHSVINIDSRDEALAFPRGDLELAFCNQCGFICNRLFEAKKIHYCSQCEETQGFSPTFSNWHRKLAQKLVHRYNLQSKSIVEIGCGKGEFLTMLCEMAGGRGLGLDPAYVPERNGSPVVDRIKFIPDCYSEKYSGYPADFICCKMTLEHLDEPLAFLRTIRRSIGRQTGVDVFFQVPDIHRVLIEIAFWDIYYEHCSYFSLGSLARTFRCAGFDVFDLTSDYDGQYIMIGARAAQEPRPVELAAEQDLSAIAGEVTSFERRAAERVADWQDAFTKFRNNGRRVVLWGSGSKAVSFLSTIRAGDAIEYVVDINPYRQGTYIAGNGQKVVSPKFLSAYQPDTVLVMNEIYLDEIRQDLASLGLKPELRAVCGKTLAVA